MNIFKTAILLTGLTLILVLAGEYFGGESGALLAFAVAAAMNFFSYFYSDKIALRMYRAQAVTRDQLPRVYAVVERLTGRARWRRRWAIRWGARRSSAWECRRGPSAAPPPHKPAATGRA